MIGKTLLHYEILEQLGKGGMGEVFRARDTKLGRDVAVKVLPPELTGDPEREARFEREARALASLQHANVASVYGFEECDGARFLVMELVPGVELTQRLAKGPVSVDDTLNIARQIAAGLEAAHESGIVHRDLKPANIMETPEGEVKILDFGLAQAWFGDSGSQSESAATPTITAAMTQVGAVLGTAAYMSPEQARGSNVDRRADIWAFGVILYEMLTGKKLFHGETISDTLAAVLRAEPEWDELPVKEAPQLCRLIERCLERNPKQRLRDIGEARIFLEDGGQSGTSLSFSHLAMEGETGRPARGKSPVVLLAGLLLAGLVIGGVVGWKVLARPEPVPVIHAMIPPPSNTDYDLNGTAPGPAAVSPDGSMVAFTAQNDEGMTQLYLRHLDKGESASLAGTEGAAYPFWSPDNGFIGYFDNKGKKLRKVAVAGGPPVTLCPAENVKGGSWNSEGEIIFAPTASSGIFKVPSIGGDPELLCELGPEYNSCRHPRFLPGGREFLFVGRPNTSNNLNSIFLASLDTSVVPRAVAESQSNADYVNGTLLTVKEDVLMATPFTPDQEKVTAGGTPLVENILTITGAAISVFSPSPTGVMVFQTGATNQAAQMIYKVDLTNGVQVVIGDPGQLSNPIISPDGTQAFIEVAEASNEGKDLWLVNLQSGLRTRFTFANGDETRAVWSPDGATVYYQSSGDGVFRIMEQAVEGQSTGTILLEKKLEIFPTSVSPDGEILLLNMIREDTFNELVALSLTDPAGEIQVLASLPDGHVGGGKFSPDGRWVAYHATTSTGMDIFVMPAGGGARKWQVTNEGAVYPMWSQDGTQLWVNKFNGVVRAYSVDGSGQTFKLMGFEDSATNSPPDPDGCNYDLFPDDQSILMAGGDPDFQTEISYLHVVTDWRRGLVQ